MKPFILYCLIGLGAALDLARSRPTKEFELNLTWDKGAPDGVERKQALINGQFPGPALIFDEGDNVEVTVNNYLPFNTTMHWHGIEQVGTSWSDGVPGVSQKLIPPGGRFVAKFTATQYGTYWYHSHVSGQIMDGLYGPIYIRPQNVPTELLNAVSNDTLSHAQIKHAIENPKLLIVSDWYHITSRELRHIAVAADIDPICVDSILLNGKGRVHCVDPVHLTGLVPESQRFILQGMNLTAKGCLPLNNTFAQTFNEHDYSVIPPELFDECNETEALDEVIEVDPLQGWASLNLISSASTSFPRVSINNHTLWVYEVDGQYIVPTQVDALTINNGARYSVLIQLNKQPGEYRITAANAGLNQKIAGFGTLAYVNGDSSIVGTASIDYSGLSANDNVVLLNETTIKPLIPSQPSPVANETYLLRIGRIEHAWKWSLNGNYSYSMAMQSEKPMLWDPESYKDSELVIFTKNDTWVDLVFTIIGTPTTLQPGHPLHKHSNKVYVLGAGSGEFNWTSVAEAQKEIPGSFNLVDPPMRDTFTTNAALQSSNWLAVRYHVENPGAFFLHCHLDPHLTGGMALAILDGVDEWPNIPAEYGPKGHWGHAPRHSENSADDD
ncbi:Multicopper oxidase type 2 [Penicillium bovifimosum]|uniref:Multicopper oxidase type 2 n=1 Tax=Penicillium bovifimosum TaxID=126998 RepID=A0A9W9L789_9EURO|nr:Multicopper oxidase type 2 [Penicillium bovifimosum]KAJ5142785.1 Multicopper oxidase type 2 [Penicillium bovifimosum]